MAVKFKLTLLAMLEFVLIWKKFTNVMDESVTSELSVTLYQSVLCSFPERPKSYAQYVIHTCQDKQYIAD